MKMKKIRLLKEWEQGDTKYAPGIYEVDEDTANELIKKGLAEEHSDWQGANEDDKGDTAKAIEEEDVARIVKQCLANDETEPVRKLPTITATKDLLEDDPNCGYPKWDHCGFGVFLRDVGRAQKAVHSGQASSFPERLMKSQKIMTKAPSGSNESVDSEGGFLVPVEQRAELLRRMYSSGAVFNRARLVPMTSKTLTIPAISESSRADGSRAGGVQAFWVAEAVAPTSSKPAFEKITLTANKLMALGYVTEELEDDASIGALQLMGDLFAEELAFKLDDAFIRGTGGGQPLGILNAPATVTVTRDTVGEINTEDIVEMYARFYGASRANGVWFFNQDIEPFLYTMTLDSGTSSTPVYMPPGGLSESPFGRILGRPAIPIEQAATLGTVGDLMLCDMSQYLFGQRKGIETEQSIHVKFTTDETAIKARLRVDGQPWWSTALTPFKGTNTQSPFVTVT